MSMFPLFGSRPIQNNIKAPLAVGGARFARLGATAPQPVTPSRSVPGTVADGGFLSTVYNVFNASLAERARRKDQEFILRQQAQEGHQAVSIEKDQTGKILTAAVLLIAGSIVLRPFLRGRK